MLKIVINMDETITGLFGSLVPKYNDLRALDLSPKDVDFSKMPEEMFSLMRERPLLFFYLDPLPGAIGGIEALMQRHDVFIVTSSYRSIEIAENKWQWIQLHLPEFSLDNFILGKKLLSPQADIMFDVDPAYLKKRPGTVTVGLDKHYNREVEPSYRASGWSEFMQVVYEIEQQMTWNGFRSDNLRV